MEGFDIVKTHYIKELIAKNMREDGRGMLDYRNIEVATDVIEHAEGSAQVDLGATRVLVGAKMQVEEPMKDTPKQGNLMVSAELLPLAHAEFESGPPSPASIELARVVDRGIRSAECIDLDSLFIEEGKVWSVFIDIYVLNYNGNLFDAGALAAMAALANTRMPKYEDDKAVYEERKTPLKINNIALSSTFGKIDRTLLLDTDIHEENAASARLTIGTDGKRVRAMQKGLGGSLTVRDVESLADVALEKFSMLKKHVNKKD